MSNRRGCGPVPNRWLHCPRKSDQIICEKFIAFKTPLNERFESQMPDDCIFTPEILLGYVKALKLKLGLWIDLTNTKRFYESSVVEANGTRYIKIQCRGHGETPSVEQVRTFINIIDEFINDRPLDLIGVHCTHGFNRTGFLIVSYMVERMDCSVEAALKAFAQARPPGIYKGDYIKELYRRYDDVEDAPLPPALPDWCLTDSEESSSEKRGHDDNEAGTSFRNGNQDDSDGEQEENGPSKKKRRREKVFKDATFMAGVPGVVLVLDQPKLGELQAKVQDMCGWPDSGFPGTQPVSMNTTNIENLHLKPYRVSWKADGTRYMMLINKRKEIYFIDRNNSVFQVDSLTFPKRENLQEHITDTLVDGEMVIEKFDGQNVPRYLIYDIICFQNQNVGQEPFFRTRLDVIKNELIGPRYEAVARGLLNRSLESFSVRNKAFWNIKFSNALLDDKFAKALSHEPDGLIFQPSKDPYKPGQCPEVLKWKPLTMNSVDFKLRIVKESGVGILPRKIASLLVGKEETEFARMKFTKEIKDLNNKIIECTYDKKQWCFLRERVDKTFPNSYNTADAVYESIKDPVTTEKLLSFIDKSRFIDDDEMMPPPRTQSRQNVQQ